MVLVCRLGHWMYCWPPTTTKYLLKSPALTCAGLEVLINAHHMYTLALLTRHLTVTNTVPPDTGGCLIEHD